MQERLEITLEMIKKVSGKFLVCENGISKIYLQDYGKSKLIFEGEYKDKKKIRGKEFNFDGKIIFDGEYVNNKRKKGKVYQNSSLIFEGEIINLCMNYILSHIHFLFHLNILLQKINVH